MASVINRASEFADSFFLLGSTVTHRQLPLFLSFILGVTYVGVVASLGTANIATWENQNQNPQDSVKDAQERTPLSEGAHSLLGELAVKYAEPPALKASIEAMSSVKIGETDGKDNECIICLEEWKFGVVAKKMPCKHSFHMNYIKKAQGIQWFLPVCKYKMPANKELRKQDEAERRRFEREI